MINIYTDGACSGNPGIGGWGAVIIKENSIITYLNGGEILTTNNRMELNAAIQAIKYFNESKKILINTDSQYVKNGIELWINNWKKNGWKTASKKPVKNKDLWIQLDYLITKHTITWKWVKGHAGNINNEKADSLARKFIEES